MPKIKEWLKGEEEIWVELEKDDYLSFLAQAKEEGFVWCNGREIGGNEEYCPCISVLATGQIAKVSCFARFGAPGKGTEKKNEQYAHVKRLKFVKL